ncbi:MAG: hypothetical protein SGPRY_012027 [Prymnesium sp.]
MGNRVPSRRAPFRFKPFHAVSSRFTSARGASRFVGRTRLTKRLAVDPPSPHAAPCSSPMRPPSRAARDPPACSSHARAHASPASARSVLSPRPPNGDGVGRGWRVRSRLDGWRLCISVLMLFCLSTACGLVVPVPSHSALHLVRLTQHVGRHHPQELPKRAMNPPPTLTAPDFSRAIFSQFEAECSAGWRAAASPFRQLASAGRADFVRNTLSQWHLAEYKLRASALSPPFETLSSALCRAAFPLRFGVVSHWYEERVGQAKLELGLIRAQLMEALESELGPDVSITIDVKTRMKSALSIFEKSVLRGKRVSDFLGVRLVVNESGVPGDELCYAVARAVMQRWPGADVKDYIARPKKNGYQSLHLLVPTSDGVKVEVQVRTSEMNEHAEKGRAAHALYKAVEARGCKATRERRASPGTVCQRHCHGR